MPDLIVSQNPKSHLMSSLSWYTQPLVVRNVLIKWFVQPQVLLDALVYLFYTTPKSKNVFSTPKSH